MDIFDASTSFHISIWTPRRVPLLSDPFPKYGKSNKAISELRVLVAGMGLLFYKNVIVYFLMVSFPSPQEWRTLYENPA